MKLMHVHAKSSVDVKLPAEVLNKIPKCRFGVVTTIQHLHKIKDVVRQLGAVLAGQVLGCNASEAEKIQKKVDAFLFVGSGEFHPVQVALKTKKPVWLWNPVSRNFGLLDEKVVDGFRKRLQGRLAKFLHAKTIGVIVSTKMGQKNLMRAYDLLKSGKGCYLFACDNIDFSEFENFSFIDFWVNTACPRIPDGSVNMINIEDLIDAGLLKLSKKPMAYEVPMWKSRLGLQ